MQVEFNSLLDLFEKLSLNKSYNLQRIQFWSNLCLIFLFLWQRKLYANYACKENYALLMAKKTLSFSLSQKMLVSSLHYLTKSSTWPSYIPQYTLILNNFFCDLLWNCITLQNVTFSLACSSLYITYYL